MGCKWSSLNALGTGNPSHPLLGLDDFPFSHYWPSGWGNKNWPASIKWKIWVISNKRGLKGLNWCLNSHIGWIIIVGFSQHSTQSRNLALIWRKIPVVRTLCGVMQRRGFRRFSGIRGCSHVWNKGLRFSMIPFIIIFSVIFIWVSILRDTHCILSRFVIIMAAELWHMSLIYTFPYFRHAAGCNLLLVYGMHLSKYKL